MKISQITTTTVANYLRLDDATDTLLQPILDASKQHVLTLTGLTAEEADDYEDLTPAVLILCQDFYDNRNYLHDRKAEANQAVDAIIASHRVNLL